MKWFIIEARMKKVFGIFGCYKVFAYFCRSLIIKNNIIMARPIKETPILFGDDARRFEERMMQVRRESPQDRARRMADYESAMRIFKG